MHKRPRKKKRGLRSQESGGTATTARKRKEKKIRENLEKNGQGRQDERLRAIIERILIGGGLTRSFSFVYGSMKNDLQVLVQRARALNEKFSDEINHCCSKSCRFCSHNGRCCGVAETPSEERQRLIAIRDSLQNVEKMLLFLQKLQSWQWRDHNSSLAQLEESRLFLIQEVTQYQGRSPQVLQELNALFGNGESGFSWDLKERMEESGQKRGSNFFVSCFKILVNPWKWHKAAGVAVRLIAVSAGISSTIHLYRNRQEYRTSQARFLALTNSKEAGKNARLLSNPNSPLDVFYGRG